ncbi:MAG: DUF438 domain-containing protein [Crenarchaeota archaeon]|nr:DUF438 domain-containing protein [Thermoproteota archaeon]
MSTMTREEKINLVKQILKEITMGADPDKLKKKYGPILREISPFEIAVIEQQLIREGVKPEDILKVCDIHVDMFREYLKDQEIEGVPEGHPLDLLIRENMVIMKMAEALSLYASAIKNTENPGDKKRHLDMAIKILVKLKDMIRRHYRKNQMLLFPYLEKRGIDAVPRVLWGREDQVIVEIRRILGEKPSTPEEMDKLADRLARIAMDIADIGFRENKILYPAAWTLLSEGEWATIHELAKEFGYIVALEKEWVPREKPVYPYMISGEIPRDKLEKLPPEIRKAVGEIKPDNYRVVRPDDIDLETGFLKREEIINIFKHLPLEMTYADNNDRVRFFTMSKLAKGFPRSKTIIGRRIGYCHPPRLEKYVMKNVEMLKKQGLLSREFWTRMGGRIIRVLIVGVRNDKGEYLGTLEIVEDMTDIVEHPEKVKEKIMVL